MNTKTIIVVLATLLIGSLCFWACQKDEIQQVKPVETEDILLKSGQGGPMMLPYRGSGTWQAIEFRPDFENMVIEIDVEVIGTATHLGRFQGLMLSRFNFVVDGDNIIPTTYVSHSNIYTAANGDELYDEGSVDNGTEHFPHDDGIGFLMTGIHILGGTGRFENAVGSYTLSATATVGFPFPGGTWELEGEIRYGKMVPFQGKGTWQNIGFEIIAPDMIKFISEGNGTGTQIGRAQFDIELLFSFDPETGPGEYITHTTTITAANGDILIFQPCPDTPGSGYNLNPEDQEPPWTWHGKYIRLVGGTGRFENAVGGYDIWGTGNLEDEPWGMMRFEGEISRPGR